MTVPICVSCHERLSCADSALSITGNLIGILTFVSAAIISILVYVNSIENASQELSIMSRRLESRVAEVHRLQNLLEQIDISGTLKRMIALDMQKAGQVFVESERLLALVSRSGTIGKRNRFMTSAKFIYMADEIKEYIGEADDTVDMLRGAATAALLHVVVTSAERMEEYLGEISAQLKRMESDNHQNTYLLEELQSMKREI